MDYAAIKSRVSMQQVIDFLGVTITKKDSPEQLRAKCPHCKSSNERALSMNTGKNLFTCFANVPKPARGDVISLVAHVKGIGQAAAAALLEEQFPQQREGPTAKRNNSKVESSRGKSRPKLQLIRTDQLKPANDDAPEPEPLSDGWTYADLI